MAARFVAALFFAVALQVAAADVLCGCAPGPYPPVTTLPYPLPGGAAPYLPGYEYATPAVVDYGYAGPYAGPFGGPYGGPYVDGYLGGFGAPGYYDAGYPYDSAFYASGFPYGGPYAPASAPAETVSVIPPVPVGSPAVVSKTAGAPSAYTTPPACQLAAFDLPVQAASSASVGPVNEATYLQDGCCSTSCAATRAKCSGTTKKVSFKTPVIIEKGTSTSSSVAPIGAPVSSHSTKAGVPQVSTSVLPGPVLPGPAYGGPYAPDFDGYYPGGYYPGGYYPGGYYPGGPYAPEYDGYYPGGYYPGGPYAPDFDGYYPGGYYPGGPYPYGSPSYAPEIIVDTYKPYLYPGSYPYPTPCPAPFPLPTPIGCPCA